MLAVKNRPTNLHLESFQFKKTFMIKSNHYMICQKQYLKKSEKDQPHLFKALGEPT